VSFGVPAGDQTFSLIGTASAVLGNLAGAGSPNAIARAVTGIGFIGGGIVFRRTVPLWPDDRRNHHGGGRFRDRRDWRGGWSRATGCGRAGDALVPIALEGPHPASQPSATAPSNRQASRPGELGARIE